MINLSIKRFQSLKEIDIDIEGLTILRGESGQGKSAVLRSIRASMTNRWTKGMIRDGEKNSEVKIDFNDGNSFTCTKSSTEIRYDVTYSNGDAKTYEKLRREIPDELGVVLGQTWIDDGDNKVAIQMRGQYDTPLIIGVSHKRLAGVMGDGEEWNKCVTTEKKLRSWLTETRGSDKLLAQMEEESLSRVEKNKKEIDEARPIVDGIKDIYDECNSMQKTLESLYALRSTIANLKQSCNECSSIGKIVDATTDLMSSCDTHSNLSELHKNLSDGMLCECNSKKLSEICSTIDGMSALQPKLAILSSINENLSSLKSIDTTTLEELLPSIDEVKSLSDKLDGLQSLNGSISSLHSLRDDKISFLVKYIVSMQKGYTIKENMAKLNDVVEQVSDLSRMCDDYRNRLSSDVCPLCGNKISEH